MSCMLPPTRIGRVKCRVCYPRHESEVKIRGGVIAEQEVGVVVISSERSFDFLDLKRGLGYSRELLEVTF